MDDLLAPSASAPASNMPSRVRGPRKTTDNKVNRVTFSCAECRR